MVHKRSTTLEHSENILLEGLCRFHGTKVTLNSKIVSEYDQEIPQSQTADNPMAPQGRAAQPSQEDKFLSKATSSLFPIKMIAILEWT